MPRKSIALAILLLITVGMWFAFDSTRLAGSAEALTVMGAQITSLRLGYAVGILFGLFAGVTLTFKVNSRWASP